jgi:hypothetical protein
MAWAALGVNVHNNIADIEVLNLVEYCLFKEKLLITSDGPTVDCFCGR